MNNVSNKLDIRSAALTLWGKSASHGADCCHLLLAHLYDTLAVGELIWDEYLGDPTRSALNAVSRGRGRQFFALLCGIHDVGKATPKFQSKVEELAERVRAAGLEWHNLSGGRSEWRHTLAGACIVRDECLDAGWDKRIVGWVWPLIGGHHGTVPTSRMITRPKQHDDHGTTEQWQVVQRWILETVARAAGFDSLADAAPDAVPPVGIQLAVSGSIIMADWLASAQGRFPPIDDSSAVSIDAARERAADAWQHFDLRTGIVSHPLPEDLMQARFGRQARPLQDVAGNIAWSMRAPGLMIIEAPMGEGKTEAALVVAEFLAERFGLRGVFVGMPTQATSDPMFHRVHKWAQHVAPDAPTMLLHGKRMFNREFESLRQSVRIGPVYEDIDTYGDTGDELGLASRERVNAPVADWFFGRKRGLLAPVSIGTVDNLLHAGTRTPHVMLRHTGLAQKVVILDEIHAASVYMSQFMAESLRWLGSAGTPVVLLTATLPPKLKYQLIQAYVGGAGVMSPELDSPGYPNVTAVSIEDDGVAVRRGAPPPWRASMAVHVELLGQRRDVGALEPDSRYDDIPDIALRLQGLLVDGGIALVIRNTVQRAQHTYQHLAKVFGNDVELLHARLTAGERAERTENELQLLSSQGSGKRPRHILVATQVAEQSFDVDADVLITDLAPIDLLLQRAGRIHRHDRGERPAPVATPRIVVTGVDMHGEAPEFPYPSEMIYGRFLLLRTAAMVSDAADRDGWTVPDDIPELVARGYGDEPTEAESRWPEQLGEAVLDRNLSRCMSPVSVRLPPVRLFCLALVVVG